MIPKVGEIWQDTMLSSRARYVKVIALLPTENRIEIEYREGWMTVGIGERERVSLEGFLRSNRRVAGVP